MTQEDIDFYNDNCFGSYKLMCTNTVPKNWERMNKRKQSREASVQRKRLKQSEDEKEQQEVNRNEIVHSMAYENLDCDSENINVVKKRVTLTEQTKHNFEQAETEIKSQNVPMTFPKVKVRNSFKTFNESVIRCIVQSQSESTCSTMEVCKIMVNVANIVFHQDWKLPDSKEDEEAKDENYDAQTNSSSEDSSEDEKLEGGTIGGPEQYQVKSRKCKKDLTMTLPSRRTIMRYLEDASYMSLKYVAQQLLNNEDSVITVGLDDTTKAAGHKSYDIKTDHITMKDGSEPKKFSQLGILKISAVLGMTGQLLTITN